jgi:putative two-component system hydrogenase maturation factor HypX/HoxX
MKQADRAIDWQRDDTATVLRKINAADGFPGVADALFGQSLPHFRCLARSESAPAVRRARSSPARDGAVAAHRRWRGLDRPRQAPGRHQAAGYAGLCRGGCGAAGGAARYWWRVDHATWQDIAYEESAGVGFLHFEFYNGAMSTVQCVRLRAALAWAKQRPVKVMVLLGGADFWSNGIHLNVIEAASLDDGSPADESWNNINAMNDLALELIETGDRITVAALGGNAGAGGCFLARAADRVWVRDGVMLNPHYKNMGNLYGSEYWTYLLPRRVGAQAARDIMKQPPAADGAAGRGHRLFRCLPRR